MGKDTVDAFESTEITHNMDEFYDDTNGWTEGAVQTLEETAVELSEDIEKVAEMIAAFFDGLQCHEVAGALQCMVTSLLQDISSGNVQNLLNDFGSQVDKYKNNLDGVLCRSMWDMALGPQAAIIAEMMRGYISTLKDKCPAAMSGSDLPAFALGFVASAEAYAGAAAGTGIELAIGMDLHGEQFCYVAGCAYGGITIGDPGFGGTGYKSISSVPGTANFISRGVGVEIPFSSIGAEAGVTYVYSGNDISDPIGVAFMAGGSHGTDALLPASVSVMHGIRYTPVCVTVDGTECGVKEPVLAIGNKNKNVACDDQPMSLSCPSGKTISVNAASYGRHDGTTCPHGETSNRNCHASRSMKYVNEMCGGKNKCTVRADHRIMGDPCGGGTYKYLEVTYGCVLSVMGRSTLTCEGGADALECLPGYVIDLQDALYGRVDRDVCPHPNIHTDTCSASGVFNRIAAECNGRSTCSPSASNSRFGDPCGDTYKYLSTKYRCVPPSTSTSALACEGNRASMSCPSGQTVSVISASYGRHDAHTCPHANVPNQNCHASNSLERVKRQCDGRRSCSPQASAGVFGDPCVGTYKYLETSYVCIPASASAELGDGLLMARMSWMQMLCLATAFAGVAFYRLHARRSEDGLRQAMFRKTQDYGARH